EPFTNALFAISGLRPVGWEELQPGTFGRGASALDQTVIIQQATPPGFGADTLLELLVGQLGLDGTPEQSGTYDDANGRTWSLYASEVPSFPISFAFYEGDAGLLLVILISEADQAEVLYNAVFTPALDALTRD